MYVCMNVCTYVYTYAFTCICMYVCIYIHTYIHVRILCIHVCIINSYMHTHRYIHTYRAGARATRASKRDVSRTRDNFCLKGYSFVMKSMFKVYFIDNEQAPREGRYSTEYVECNCRCGSPLASFFFF
jgi:hypothetical protein